MVKCFVEANKMNREQLICMWSGVVVLIAIPLFWAAFLGSYGDFVSSWPRLILWIIFAFSATSGLIYAFRDKPQDKERKEKKNENLCCRCE